MKLIPKLMFSALFVLGISGAVMAQGVVSHQEEKAQGAIASYQIQTGTLHANAIKYQKEFPPQVEIKGLKIDAVTGMASVSVAADLSEDKLRMHIQSYLVNLASYARAKGENIPAIEANGISIQKAHNPALRADGKPIVQEKSIIKN